jgi:hypothetical protein
MVEIGDKIMISSDNDNENYKKWRGKILIVEDVAYSREEHAGYDEGVGGALVSCKDFPFSLYEYEFEIVESKGE